ncbi:MAG: DUF4127 family protein [Actinomycetota bacterium]|nr:DUF4127 family protein [Actinomycetota bacterium]
MCKKLSVLALIPLIIITSISFPQTKTKALVKDPPLTILYVPLDNRPINYDYVIALSKTGDGIELILPPADLLNTGEATTDAPHIWQWVFKNAKEADALVLSLDTLFYGGLVPSRKHQLQPAQLQDRITKLYKLTDAINAPVYAFSTVMRSLNPRGEQHSFSPDAINRRNLNLQMTEKTLLMVESGKIDFLIVSLDDVVSFSKADKGSNRLTEAIATANKKARRVEVFHGADELGSLLFARAVNDLSGYKPKIFVTSLSDLENRTILLYEDRPFISSMSLKINALGGQPVSDPDAADLVLLINAAQNGVREASAQSGGPPSEYHHLLANKIESLISRGYPVALADISYANGADDSLMKLLAEKRLLFGLAAYSGWNTAANSIGTALAQGSLYSLYRQKESLNKDAHLQNLALRMVEDWGYQARIRRKILDRYGLAHGGIPLPPYIIEAVMADLNSNLPIFFATDLANNFPNVYLSEIALPWDRLFDISFRVEINP